MKGAPQVLHPSCSQPKNSEYISFHITGSLFLSILPSVLSYIIYHKLDFVNPFSGVFP